MAVVIALVGADVLARRADIVWPPWCTKVNRWW
jgi:hypothetical protein